MKTLGTLFRLFILDRGGIPLHQGNSFLQAAGTQQRPRFKVDVIGVGFGPQHAGFMVQQARLAGFTKVQLVFCQLVQQTSDLQRVFLGFQQRYGFLKQVGCRQRADCVEVDLGLLTQRLAAADKIGYSLEKLFRARVIADRPVKVRTKPFHISG